MYCYVEKPREIVTVFWEFYNLEPIRWHLLQILILFYKFYSVHKCLLSTCYVPHIITRHISSGSSKYKNKKVKILMNYKCDILRYIHFQGDTR